MKILMVNKYLFEKGGAETYVLKIGRYLEEIGMQVEYFGMFDEKNIVSNTAGKYTSNMDFHHGGLKKFTYPFKIIYSLEARKAIRKVMEDFKPDLVHLNNINFQLTPAIIDEIHKFNIPIIQTVHDYQMLCPNHLLFDIEKKKPCELCIENSKWNCWKKKCIHGSSIKSFLGSLEAILYKKRKTYELVDQFICPSFFMERKLLRNPIFKGKTITIHNFIEQEDITSLEKKKEYVLYFGRLSEEKGLDLFLESCKKLSKIHFVVAGGGPMEDKCIGITNVEYVGFKRGEELKKLIQQAQFSVYPSIWYENCPLSVLESQSLGTPVVATNMGGIPELIDDGKTGKILNVIEEEEMSRTIEDLYNNKEEMSRMVKTCLSKRKDMITLESYCKLLMELYRSILSKSVKEYNGDEKTKDSNHRT